MSSGRHYLLGLGIQPEEALARIPEIEPLLNELLFLETAQGVSHGSCWKKGPVYDLLLR